MLSKAVSVSVNIMTFSAFFESGAAGYIAYCVEPAFKRMASLFQLAFQDQYREDRLSDGVAEFIEKGEFLGFAYFLS